MSWWQAARSAAVAEAESGSTARLDRRLYLLSVEDEHGVVHTAEAPTVRSVARQIHEALVAARHEGAIPADFEEYLNGLLTGVLWELEDLSVEMVAGLEAQGVGTPQCLQCVQVFLATAKRHLELSLQGLLDAFQAAADGAGHAPTAPGEAAAAGAPARPAGEAQGTIAI